MIRIVETRRLGVTVYVATICADGHVYMQSVHMSEGGARAWIQRQLNILSRGIQAA